MRLREPEPVVVTHGEGHIGPLEMLDRRDHVHDRELRHTLRVVERQPVRDARAAIVRHDAEGLVAERMHQLDHVARHCPLRVRRVVGARRRFERTAVAAQVGGYHGVVPREPRCNPVPHRMGLRVAVQEQQGWPLAAAAQAQLALGHRDVLESEPGKEVVGHCAQLNAHGIIGAC